MSDIFDKDKEHKQKLHGDILAQYIESWSRDKPLFEDVRDQMGDRFNELSNDYLSIKDKLDAVYELVTKDRNTS